MGVKEKRKVATQISDDLHIALVALSNKRIKYKDGDGNIFELIHNGSGSSKRIRISPNELKKLYEVSSRMERAYKILHGEIDK